jgi:hypothetical protein
MLISYHFDFTGFYNYLRFFLLALFCKITGNHLAEGSGILFTAPRLLRDTMDGPLTFNLNCIRRFIMLNIKDDLQVMMANANDQLQSQGYQIQLNMIEYYTAQDQQGRTVFFNNVGNKRLSHDFVANDPRRADWSGATDDITWAMDGSFPDASAGGVLDVVASQSAIANAMATWQNLACANLPLNVNATSNANIGFMEYIIFGSGSPVIAADVVHAGFGTPVDLLLPPPVIAATFTFTFTDTDIDNNGMPDVAFREIYYTNNFNWGINSNIDVETVALHEAGHALSQAHFGKLHKTERNGKFHFAPKAVMNAGYTGVQQQLAGSDNAGHCSNWGSWPNN